MKQVREQLAQAGLQLSYLDIWNKEQQISDKTVEAMAQALQLDADDTQHVQPLVLVVTANAGDPAGLGCALAASIAARGRDGNGRRGGRRPVDNSGFT